MAKSAWSDEYYVTIYELARSGLSNEAIAQSLGVARPTLRIWMRRRPAAKSALKRGRQRASGETNGKAFSGLEEYVYNKLPAGLQETYNRLREFERCNAGTAQIEALLKNKGKNARQCLFLHAFTASAFNASHACRMVGINRRTLDQWLVKDHEFATLFQEVRWHLKNFYECALVNEVIAGNPQAIIFANRTFNKDRGYNDKVDIEVSGQVQHNHLVLDLDSLNLPLAVRTKILDAMEQHEAISSGNVVEEATDA